MTRRERLGSQLEVDAEALSITRLEGSRWRGGRLWSSKWDLRAWPVVDQRAVGARATAARVPRVRRTDTTHEQVMQRLERLGSSCAQLEALRHAAEEARDAVRAGDLDALGRAMCENTNAQAGLHTDLVHRDAWRVIEIAAAHGANGWKVNGAGGEGGSVTLLCDPRPAARRATIRAIMQANPAFAAIPVTISHEGLSVISDP